MSTVAISRTSREMPARISFWQCGADQRQPLRPAQPLHGKRNRNVLAGRQMRVERVGLEHHGDVAIGCGDRRHVLASNEDLAAVGMIKPGKNAQQGALAAARGADQGDELARFDIEADAVQNGIAAKGFVQAAKRERAHDATFPRTLCASCG
ncbi:hypothetical protein ACVWWD_005164 [Mesorhizobium sp. URHB0026]